MEDAPVVSLQHSGPGNFRLTPILLFDTEVVAPCGFYRNSPLTEKLDQQIQPVLGFFFETHPAKKEGDVDVAKILKNRSSSGQASDHGYGRLFRKTFIHFRRSVLMSADDH